MNCQLYEKEFEAYLHNRLPLEQKLLLEKHLEECTSCSESLFLERLAGSFILEEKMELPDPSLAEQVMLRVMDKKPETGQKMIQATFLRNIVYATSVAAAIFAGIVAGNFYKPVSEETIPAELSYMDDGQMEAVNLFLDEN